MHRSGDDEIAAARKELGWESAPFEIPADIAPSWDGRERGADEESAWNDAFAAYKAEYPELAAEIHASYGRQSCRLAGAIRGQGDRDIDAAGETVATRKASLIALNAFAPACRRWPVVRLT